jgi:hypothetical protein
MSSETVLARKELLSLGQLPVGEPVVNVFNRFGYIETYIKCSHQEIQQLINHARDNCTSSSGDVSQLKSGSVEDTSINSNSTVFESKMINKDTTVNNSEDNLQSHLGDLETKSEHYKKLTNNEPLLPFENSINDSDVKPEHLLKPLKNDNNEDFVLHDNAFCLSISNYNKEFDTECSTIPAKQGNHTVLLGNCEQTRVCADDLIRRTCSKPKGSSPLSVECTQCNDVNKRKRKHRNKTRKGRSTQGDIEGLQEE